LALEDNVLNIFTAVAYNCNDLSMRTNSKNALAVFTAITLRVTTFCRAYIQHNTKIVQCVLLIVVILSVIMLGVVRQDVAILSVIMLSVIMLNVVSQL